MTIEPNPTPNLTFPIVGSFYRPPSVSIIKNLPLNTPLVVHADPTNPRDPNALGIWISKSDIPFDKIKMKPETNMEYNKNDEFHIGFIPAVDAANLRFDRTLTVLGLFKLDPNGKPQIKLTGFKKEEPQ